MTEWSITSKGKLLATSNAINDSWSWIRLTALRDFTREITNFDHSMNEDCTVFQTHDATRRWRLAAMIMTMLGCIFATQVVAQGTSGLSEDKLARLLDGLSNGADAPEGELTSFQAFRQIRKLDKTPEKIIERAICLAVSRDSHKRVPARLLLETATLNVQQVSQLIDAVGTIDERKTQFSYSVDRETERWARWISKTGQKVVPTLQRSAEDETKTPRQRALARAGLDRIELTGAARSEHHLSDTTKPLVNSQPSRNKQGKTR